MWSKLRPFMILAVISVVLYVATQNRLMIEEEIRNLPHPSAIQGVESVYTDSVLADVRAEGIMSQRAESAFEQHMAEIAQLRKENTIIPSQQLAGEILDSYYSWTSGKRDIYKYRGKPDREAKLDETPLEPYHVRETWVITDISRYYSLLNGTDYSAVYNYDYYTEHYPSVKAQFGIDYSATLNYFIDTGMSLGHQGCANFDVYSYRNQYPDLRIAYGSYLPSYYYHYISSGRAQGRIATGVYELQNPIHSWDGIDYSAVYNYWWYMENNPSLAASTGGDDVLMIEDFVYSAMPSARSGNGIFDAVSYRNQYPDLRASYGKDWSSYYIHYCNYGQYEGRICSGVPVLQNPVTVASDGTDVSAIYDYYYYTATYPDVVSTYGDDDVAILQHFVTTGMREGRKGKESYDQAKYDELYEWFNRDPMIIKAQEYSSDTGYLILVNCSEHRVAIFSGSKGRWEMINTFYCSDGDSSTPTPIGEYSVTSKFTYFDSGNARCWYATGFVGSEYLFHSVLYYQEEAPNTIMDPTLGESVSHGCIRLELSCAKWIYDNMPIGTAVITYR